MIISVSADEEAMALAQPKVLKLRVGDPLVVIQLESQFERVTACEGAHLPDPVEIVDKPDIPRVEEMILCFFRIIPHVILQVEWGTVKSYRSDVPGNAERRLHPLLAIR